jgi:uncharacterized protein YcfJ
MKPLLALAASLAITAPTMSVPTLALAQSARDYGSGDICAQQRRSAATKGTIIGGLLGAIFGGSVAGHGAKTEGAVVGGVAGAVAGNQIGRHSVKCSAYPRGVTNHRDNCRWVEEYYSGEYHDFEVCQDRDGVWRPSGRG